MQLVIFGLNVGHVILVSRRTHMDLIWCTITEMLSCCKQVSRLSEPEELSDLGTSNAGDKQNHEIIFISVPRETQSSRFFS